MLQMPIKIRKIRCLFAAEPRTLPALTPLANSRDSFLLNRSRAFLLSPCATSFIELHAFLQNHHVYHKKDVRVLGREAPVVWC